MEVSVVSVVLRGGGDQLSRSTIITENNMGIRRICFAQAARAAKLQMKKVLAERRANGLLADSEGDLIKL